MRMWRPRQGLLLTGNDTDRTLDGAHGRCRERDIAGVADDPPERGGEHGQLERRGREGRSVVS